MTANADTVKARTHSLPNQGLLRLACTLSTREERAMPLRHRFDLLRGQHPAAREISGLV
jgi:hypothetical protein